MTTPELDRAIEVADHKVKERYDQKQKRRHARALIAELLRGMEPPEHLNSAGRGGFMQAIRAVESIAGIGDKDHD